MLPREISRSTVTQTARPALHVRRRFRLVGFGADAVRAFTAILMVGAILGLFAALVQVLEERQEDLAVMRAPGATQLRLFWQIMAESLILTVAGAGLGLATALRMACGSGEHKQLLVPFAWVGGEALLVLTVLGLGRPGGPNRHSTGIVWWSRR